MDNPLTPKKIQKLINLAEDRSLVDKIPLFTEEDIKRLRLAALSHSASSTAPAFCESSSGILDLDHMDGFGDTGSITNMSLSKSTAFNPGEMTGRSTGAEQVTKSTLEVPAPKQYGRHSIDLDSIINEMDKQTNEINEIMRHSIATNTNYSFQSKRDLTADEASLIAREAPLPVMQTTQTYFHDSVHTNTSNISVGAYFKNRCIDFQKILGKTDSPDRSMMPSITEVSSSALYDYDQRETSKVTTDDMLDSVPVRQPRNSDVLRTELGNTTYIQKTLFKEPALSKAVKPEPSKKVLEKHTPGKSLNPAAIPHKAFMTSSKPADVLFKNIHSSFRVAGDETEASIENSLSISKIADYLGNQSNVSVTDMMQLNQKRPVLKKQPLTELHINAQTNHESQVTNLIDSRKAETASSAGTIDTVISLDKLKIQEERSVHDDKLKTQENKLKIQESKLKIQEDKLKIQEDKLKIQDDKLKMQDDKLCRQDDMQEAKIRSLDRGFEVANIRSNNALNEEDKGVRSKSPSSRSQSTLSTIRDNFSSFKSGDSPNSSKGEANRSKVPSPNIAYKELDKSVDWQEVLLQKRIRQRGVAKEHLVEVASTPVNGYVGVSTAITMAVTTLCDSWLTAKFQFDSLPNDGKDLNVELPRLPLLLSPGKSEDYTFYLTSNIALDTTLPFTFYVKDASLDGDVEQKGELQVKFTIPVVQALSADGMNKLTFPPVQEKTSVTKTFALVSDCPADLQIKLLITEGENFFSIKSVQEIKKSDVNKAIMERQSSEDRSAKGKPKLQLCRLTSASAIRVTVTFDAPNAADLKASTPTVNGALHVTLINGNTILRKVDLVGVIGAPELAIKSQQNKIKVSKEPTDITVTNVGLVSGKWVVKYEMSNSVAPVPFVVAPNKFSLAPNESKTIQMMYTAPENVVNEISIRFEETTTGKSSPELTLTGGTERPRTFPLKSNHNSLSWVQAGRKEVSLKNNFDKKVHIRCQIIGEGFNIDLPGGESRGIYVLTFNACECRPLPISFAPTSCMPHTATLHLAYDPTSEYSRRIKLFGCMSGEPVRWSGLVTFSETAALVRATFRAPLELTLHNKSAMPAFIAARVQFNLQYAAAASWSRLAGARRVIPARARHTLALRPDWARLQRLARAAPPAALATLTVLTGAETTRRRILKIFRDESDGTLDPSLLPDHLKVLAMEFDGEDDVMDNLFVDFKEPKECLSELMSGLRELTAHIDLPRDFAEDNTIIISDDTMVEHHTLCD